MNDHRVDLKRFERRVRLVRSWKGLAIGACFGSLIAGVWAALDYAHVAYAEWSGLGAVVGISMAVGFMAGLLMRVSSKALADSIDRRADLEERLVTSLERTGSDDGFDAALHADAQSHLHELKPSKLYPVRVGRWQATALVLAALASGIFILGNTAVFMNDQQKKDRAEMKQAGQIVERVLKPVDEDLKTPSQNQDEKRLAEELRKLSKDLEKARLSKEEALQKSNEIQKQAEELTKDKAENTEQSLAKAESALDMLQKAELEKNGLGKMDPRDAKMSDAERQSKENSLQQQQNSLQQQISALQQQQSQKGLSESQKQELDKKLQALLNQQKSVQKSLQQLKLSKNVQDMLKRMMENPAYKELQELAQKLAKAAQLSKQGPGKSAPPLTKEQLDEMQKKLEELAKKLSSDKAMTEYLKALMEALKNAKGMCNCQGVCLLPGLLGLGGFNPYAGAGAPTQDLYFSNTGWVHKSAKPEASKGTTTLTSVTGQRDETKPGETYIEIKGPTTVGNRSSIAYTKDVLAARKKAEQAIDRQKIPKEQEKRVKAYFDSLTNGH